MSRTLSGLVKKATKPAKIPTVTRPSLKRTLPRRPRRTLRSKNK